MRIFLLKTATYDEAWRPQYREVQRHINKVVSQVLRTTNGLVRWEVINQLLPTREQQQKLFKPYSAEYGEWLEKIQTVQKIAYQLKVDPQEIPFAILNEYYNTRDLKNRRMYPHLVSSTYRKYISEEHFGQVYGFSVLIRPPADTHQGFVDRQDITTSKNYLVIYLHLDLTNPSLEDFSIRTLYWFKENYIVDFRRLAKIIVSVKELLYENILKKNYTELIDIIARKTNDHINRQYQDYRDDGLARMFFSTQD
jgi:hypothetical protein